MLHPFLPCPPPGGTLPDNIPTLQELLPFHRVCKTDVPLGVQLWVAMVLQSLALSSHTVLKQKLPFFLSNGAKHLEIVAIFCIWF